MRANDNNDRHRRHHDGPAAAPGSGADTAGLYTCPMHPEVKERGPGSCPKCGMALEPNSVSAAATRTEYTCPMHPEVVRGEPGDCPICGMALEPRTVSVEEGPNPELVDMTRRFWVAAALTLPLVLIAMAGMLPSGWLSETLAGTGVRWLELALATPVVAWAGWPFFVRGWNSLVTRHLNMFTLIAMGVGAAYGFSIVAVALPGLFAGADHGPRGSGEGS